jgi:hypothetical protein
MINTLEHYQQTYTYDTGNNLTALSHQENSNNFNHSTDSIALVIIDIVLCSGFVWFVKFAKCIVVVPM